MGIDIRFAERNTVNLNNKNNNFLPYCVDEFHDSFHWKAACGADSVNIVIKRH